MEDGVFSVDVDFSLLPIGADDVLAQHTVEVDAELVADHVEVVEVGEGGVVLHDDKHAAGSDPLDEFARVLRISKVRVGVLVDVVG